MGQSVLAQLDTIMVHVRERRINCMCVGSGAGVTKKIRNKKFKKISKKKRNIPNVARDDWIDGCTG